MSLMRHHVRWFLAYIVLCNGKLSFLLSVLGSIFALPPVSLHRNHCACTYYVTNDRGKADILIACKKSCSAKLFFPLMKQLCEISPCVNTNEDPPAQLKSQPEAEEETENNGIFLHVHTSLCWDQLYLEIMLISKMFVCSI